MSLDILDKFFLPILFFIGIITSWEDYRAGKIRNKWIIFGVIFALVILFSMVVWNFIGDSASSFYYSYIKDGGAGDFGRVISVGWSYFGKVALNSFLALILGYSLWKFKLIAAGDAKLFFLFSLLLPLKYYWKSYLPVFPSFVLVINIILPIFFFIFLQAAWYYIKKIKSFVQSSTKIDWKKTQSKFIKWVREFSVLLLGLMVISLLLQKFRHLALSWLAPIFPDDGFLLLLLFLLYRPIRSALRKNKITLYLILGIFGLYMIGGAISAPLETISELRRVLIRVGIFMLFMKLTSGLINHYIKNSTIKNININNIKSEMRFVEVEPMKKNDFKEKLSQEKIEILKVWAHKKNIKNIKIYQKFSFAMWIFFGVIITIILQKSLLSIIIEAIGITGG